MIYFRLKTYTMKREKMRFTLILILSLLLTNVSGRAYALSCAVPSLDKSIVTNSVAIFEGVAGKKQSLTWKQKAAVKINNLKGKGGDIKNLSVYDFTVTKNWKGVATGRTVSILFNTYWGDNYVPDGKFLIVSPQKIGDMFWTPLCGNSVDLEWARQKGDTAVLEEVIGVGHHIKIPAKDRACKSTKDCTAIQTHCGGCDCGTPVNIGAVEGYKEQFQKFCAMARVMEHCEIVCETYLPSCYEGLCQ